MEEREQLWKAEDAFAAEAEEVSDFIFHHAELGDQEYVSSAYLADKMQAMGFRVEKPYLGFETAFRCEYGDEEGPAVAFLAEYDALKGYGPGHDEIAHACGHNWIAASTMAACAALKAVKPLWKGKIIYIGTPAEENIGRKVDMAELGAFDGLAAAFQVHLGHDTILDPTALAMTDFVFEFRGKAAHASGHPAKGINALDGCMLTMAGINALRQHLEPDVRIHYTITNGGKSPNVVPDYASMAVYVRAGQKDYLEEVIEKVLNCGRGAALMTGSEFSWKRAANTYYDIRPCEKLSDVIWENLQTLGIKERVPGDRYHCGSSDIGNVSYHCPTCYLKLGTGDFSDADVHEEAYLKVVNSDEGNRLLHIAAKAMAATALDVLQGKV